MQRYGLQSIRHAKPRHIQRYFGELRDAGLSPGRIANFASAIRIICRAMGKLDIVPTNRELGCARDVANRTKHADERINPVKATEVREQLSPNNQIAYDMARQFGLRQKETLLSHKAVSQNGVDYLVVEGAKGGRPRQVPINTDRQREVLTRNHAYRAVHNGSLIDEDKSLKQGIKQLQNELAAADATRTSGANMHSLRREWVIEQCRLIILAPEASRETMVSELVEAIGHGRLEVLRAYTTLLDEK